MSTALVLAVLFVGLCGIGYFGRATQFERPSRDYNEPFAR